MKKLFVSFLLSLCFSGVFAQAKKMTTGYIFEDYIFENYIEVKRLNAEIEKKQETFQTEFNKRALQYQDANLDYQNSMKDLSNITTESINVKLKNVQKIKEDAENYQRNAEKELQEFIGSNINRIKSEIKSGTQTVSKQKGVLYVFTRNKADNPMSNYRMVLFADDQKTVNLSDDILKLLNKK